MRESIRRVCPLVLLALSACYGAAPIEGLPCSESGACPEGQSCSAQGLCFSATRELSDVDAGVVDAGEARADAGEDESCPAGTVDCDGVCQSQCVSRFEDTGEQSYAVPTGCSRLQMSVWGAGGGNGELSGRAAAGGFASFELNVSAGSVFAVLVGSPGGDATESEPGQAGFPGGGAGGSGSSQSGGGGGGFSGVFRDFVAGDSAVAIAGGGGGSGGGLGGTTQGGAGGGIAGQTGSGGGGVQAGTQDAGFAALQGGDGATRSSGDGGGGGGGGWFGGFGGTGANTDARGGGGGSGYVAGDGGVLLAGDREVPGNFEDAVRGSAGEPGANGLVVLRCFAE